MSMARWNKGRVQQGSCSQRGSLAKLPAFTAGHAHHATARGAACAASKNFTRDRDSRPLACRLAVLRRAAVKLRRRKVEVLRRQIKDGSYDVDRRLATILDRMVEDLVAEGNEKRRP